MASLDEQKAKSYQRIRQILTLAGLGWTPLVLGLTVMTPLSSQMKAWAERSDLPLVQFGFYFLFLSLWVLGMDLPWSYYSGYRLEKRFGLSTQSFAAWALDFLKRSVLSFVLFGMLLAVLYGLIWRFPESWWLRAWAVYLFFAYVLGKFFPVMIVPLFFKYEKINDPDLLARVQGLCQKYGMSVRQLYSLNLSRKTKKANAALMGLGSTKRVVLSDTLLVQFSKEEIEMVVAHELGHLVHRDLWKQLAMGALTSFLAFAAAGAMLEPFAVHLGYRGAGDLAAMPILFLVGYVIGLGVAPLQNAFSRRMEYAADRFALREVPRLEVFRGCMEKLGRINLADPSPHPLYEWFFYDHPSLSKRIHAACAQMHV